MHETEARDTTRDDTREGTRVLDDGRAGGRDVRRQDGTSLTAGYIDRVRADARHEADDVFEAEAAADR